jgi:hypothetical protein
MRRYNIASRIIPILTVITFALAAPALVQDKRQACVDAVGVPEDVISVLRKRNRGQDLNMLLDSLRFLDDGVHLHEPAPPPNVPPLNPAEVHVQEVHVPPQGPADSDHESMDLDDDAPPGSPESGHSHSPAPSPEGSTESEDWRTAPTSPW